MSKRTFNALLSRGVDTKLASDLADRGLTLSKLKQSSLEELKKLGLGENMIESLLKEARPPIPTETVIELLYRSKRTCCICRDSEKSVVIHHLKEWHTSKDHSEKNLVVLCLEHHNEAHTKRGLSINLSRKELIASKKKWIEAVLNADALNILGLSTSGNGRWDYFNHNRIFEMYLDKNLKNTKFKTTYTVRQLGLINELGTFPVADLDRTQIYNFDNGYMLAYYMKELFEDVLQTIPLIDITDKFNRESIRSLVKPGKFISFQGGFYFKDLTKSSRGRGQRRLCYYKKDKIILEFEFDAYEATSNSAWGNHLRGKRVVTPVCFVKSIIEDSGQIKVGLSCLAMGAYFREHEYRSNAENLHYVSGRFNSAIDLGNYSEFEEPLDS